MHYVSPLSTGSHQASTPFLLSYFGRSGRLWAIGATTWTTSRSIHFRRFMSPMSPESPFIPMSYTSSRLMHYVSPLSPGSDEASMPLSYFGRSRSPVSHRSRFMNHIKIYPFSDVSCPHWAMGATSYQCHIHLVAWCTMCPHWAPGATRLQHPLHLAISNVPGPLWAIGTTLWITPRSIHFLHINVIYI